MGEGGGGGGRGKEKLDVSLKFFQVFGTACKIIRDIQSKSLPDFIIL